MPLPAPQRWPALVWVVIVVAAAPLAWGVAELGFVIAVVSPARDLLWLALWSITEEVIFRGGVQQALARVPRLVARRDGTARPAWHGVSLPNALTTVLFCAVHLGHKPALVAWGIFPVSLLLGASLERSGRLLVPIALHLWFNVLLYAASAWRVG